MYLFLQWLSNITVIKACRHISNDIIVLLMTAHNCAVIFLAYEMQLCKTTDSKRAYIKGVVFIC